MDNVRYDPVWRRIRRDSYTDKLEGSFPDRFARLAHLSNWGSLAWLHPHATATKQAHHLGLEHNAMRYLDLDAERIRHRPGFRAAAHVLHWGHLPLSYQGAEALLRASHVEPEIARVLSQVIDEVIAFAALRCRADGHQGDCADAVLQGDRPFELYRWLSAWLVKENWRRLWQAIKAAEQAAGGNSPDEGTTRRELVRALVCHDDRGFQVLDGCNKADYVPRDLLQCGTAWLTLDPDVLWEHDPLGPRAAREWALIDAALSYLDRRFYATPTSLLLHVLVARAIAADVIGRSFGISELRQLLDTEYGDDHFRRTLRPFHRNRLTGLSDDARKGFEAVWTEVGVFQFISLPEGSRFEAEDFLVSRTGGQRLSYPFHSNYSVFVEPSRTRPALAGWAGPGRTYRTVYCHHRAVDQSPRIRPVLDVLAKVEAWGRRQDSSRVGSALLSWVLGGEPVEQRTTLLEQICGEIVAEERTYLSARVRALRTRASLGELNHHFDASLLADMFSDPTYAELPPPRGDWLLRFPWRAIAMSDGRAIMERLRERSLAMSRRGRDARRGPALELAVAADQLLSPDPCAHRFLVMNAVALSERREPTSEWDVIRIDLMRDGQWNVTAVECAVNRKPAKDDEARKKLDRLRAELQEYADLAWYRPWLASPGADQPAYEDAGRSYTRAS